MGNQENFKPQPETETVIPEPETEPKTVTEGEEHQEAEEEETENKQQKSESEKGSEIYEVIEIDDGRFEAVFPGLLDKESGLIVGTSREKFETLEEAKAAVESSKENIRTRYERISLEKSFTDNFYKIDETEDGQFRVTLPGLIDSKTGYYVGTASKEFPSWDEAKDFYLQWLEGESKLTEHPILEVQVSKSEQIAFSDFDSFNPKVAPAEIPKDIPQSIKKYMLQQERMAGEAPSASTYQETIKEKDWERKLFSFVSSYLEKNGEQIIEKLGIKSLDALTPRQAVDLTTRLVVELTKYKYSDAEKQNGSEHLGALEKSKADQSTVLNLLEEGLANKNNNEWEGNGVCRNFASITKAVFEALKVNQTRFNRLQDTYCLYDNGTEAFAPRRDRKNVFEMDKTGHAWNTFVTTSESEANATIVDTTWAKRNLDTGEIEGLDHTLMRMEPAIHQVASELPEDAPDKKEQMEHIFSYYQLKMESPNKTEFKILSIKELDANQKTYYKQAALKNVGDKHDLSQASEEQLVRIGQQFIVELKRVKKQKEENQFFSSRIVDILKGQKDIPKIPTSLLEIIGREYGTLAEDADLTEIETLWRVTKTNPELSFSDILKGYLKNKKLTDYHNREFISGDDELQRAIFEEIKTNPKFDEFMKESPIFRIRMREVIPQLFIDFSPGVNEADARELKYFIDNSRFLRFGRLFNTQEPSEESANGLFSKAREALRSMNPEKYKQIAENISDHELIRKYDSLYLQLQDKKAKI
jgi:hypothetical protein